MIKYSEPFMKKKFYGESLKEAKIKALKWVGKNVMCKDNMHEIMYHFENNPVEENCVILVLFAALNESDVLKRHCSICKEFHKSFFINENINCNECRAMAYRTRLSETLKVKKSYYKQELKNALEVTE